MITFPIARAGAATLEIQGKKANRHGLIAGATGTGKTVTLRRMAEAFSNQGVPVFLADVKGDLSGIVNAGADSGKVGERIAEFGLGAAWLQSFPVRFWDVFGEAGIPLRVTISEMGPMLLSRLMNLNDTHEGLLNLVFRVADDNGWHLIDLKDVGVEFPIYDAKSRSFKSQVANLTRGVISSKKESSTVTVKSLDGLTFSLKEGDKLGLIGNNGAGKSTLLKLLAGIYEPTSGTIKRKGKIVPLLDIALGMDDDFVMKATGLDLPTIRSLEKLVHQ